MRRCRENTWCDCTRTIITDRLVQSDIVATWATRTTIAATANASTMAATPATEGNFVPQVLFCKGPCPCQGPSELADLLWQGSRLLSPNTSKRLKHLLRLHQGSAHGDCSCGKGRTWIEAVLKA